MSIVAVNRQRSVRMNLPLLEEIAGSLLAELRVGDVELEINVISAHDMTCLNEKFLRHKGSTDVIAFDYLNSGGQRAVTTPKTRSTTQRGASLHGEIFVCADEAVIQARKYRTCWQSEVVRYLVHGILHLLGYSDLRLEARRRMKRAEDRLLRRLARRFSLAELGPAAKLARCTNR